MGQSLLSSATREAAWEQACLSAGLGVWQGWSPEASLLGGGPEPSRALRGPDSGSSEGPQSDGPGPPRNPIALVPVGTPPPDSRLLRAWGLCGETPFCSSWGHRHFLKAVAPGRVNEGPVVLPWVPAPQPLRVPQARKEAGVLEGPRAEQPRGLWGEGIVVGHPFLPPTGAAPPGLATAEWGPCRARDPPCRGPLPGVSLGGAGDGTC